MRLSLLIVTAGLATLTAAPAFAECANLESIRSQWFHHGKALFEAQRAHENLTAIVMAEISTMGNRSDIWTIVNVQRDKLQQLSAQIKNEDGLTQQAKDLFESCRAQ